MFDHHQQIRNFKYLKQLFCNNCWKSKRKYQSFTQTFLWFPKNRTKKSLFLSPTNILEIQYIISSTDSNKSVGPNSIPTKKLKLLTNDISSQLVDIFNISFSTGVFPTKLKLAKVVSVYKKDSKLDFSNYRPTSLLSKIEMILEKLMYNRIYNFFTKNNLIYLLQLGFRIQYSTFIS